MIYIKDFNPDSLQHLIKHCFIEPLGFPQTFRDKECTDEQCRQGANRSFSDIVELSKTYFPEVTERDIAKCLIGKVSNLYCEDIEKLVFYNEGIVCNTWHDYTEGVDGWSLNKIKELL